MNHFIVTECYGSLHISDSENNAMSSMQADELFTYVSSHGLDQDLIRMTRQSVTFINYVGLIQLSTCSIEVLPKVSGNEPSQSRRVLLRMLERTGYLDIHESETAQLNVEKMNLFEILAHLYTDKVLKELSRGVIKKYIEQQDELNTVRGKIDTTAQMRRAHLKSTMVSCTYDEFHPDHSLNIILKAALRRIVLLSNQINTRKRAGHAMIYLEDVTDTMDQRLLRTAIHFDRSNRRFKASYRLAMLILSRSAPTPQIGRNSTSSILFKMNDLFEGYIAYLVRKLTSEVVLKDRSHKLLVKTGTAGRGVFQLEPDILICDNMDNQMIIDTKWKMIDSSYSRHGVKREDFYQMYAYLTRYENVGTVILLYPHHDGINQAQGVPLESWHVESQPDKRLLVYSVDYENESCALKELQDILKEQ
ncbi:McrC family protein [Paenibacillus sp. CMAA1364]